MQVLIPSPLRSYTANKNQVEIKAASTLFDALSNLEEAHPGIRFRMIDEQDGIRQHIKIYVDKTLAADLSHELTGQERIQIVCALSGG